MVEFRIKLVLCIKELLWEMFALVFIIQFHICKAMTNNESFKLLRKYPIKLNLLFVINNKVVNWLNLVIKKCFHTFKQLLDYLIFTRLFTTGFSLYHIGNICNERQINNFNW